MTPLKETLKQYSNSKNILKKSIFFLSKHLWFLIKLISSPSFRNEQIHPLLHNRGKYNQHSTYTKENRYPVLFRITQEYFKKKQTNTLKILSFGCSTGEELKSINDYLPNAQITGLDINPWCISQAKRKYKNKNFRFIKDYRIINTERYDAIFALAVLQHSANRSKGIKKAQKFTFVDFEKNIKFLDNLLKPKGIIIIDQTDFRFTDTDTSKRYIPLHVKGNYFKRPRPLFNESNKKANSFFEGNRIFVKKDEQKLSPHKILNIKWGNR